MLELLVEGAAHAGEHVEPTALGFMTPGKFVALAMIVVLLIMWRAGVPRIVAGILDSRIAEIRKQLDEAAKLRAEAEALKAEYEKKAKQADAEIEKIREGAERQAKEIVAKAKEDAKGMVARRKQMAEEKIAAAERQAIADLRAKAAQASTAAAAAIISERHDAEADSKLADETIAGL